MAHAQRNNTVPQSFAAPMPEMVYQPTASEDSLVGELTPARSNPLRLALWSVLPGTGLLGAVLAARVLLAGPVAPPAPTAVIVEAPPAPAPSPASVAPIVEDVPAAAPKVEPTPARKERSSRSSSSSDSPRATRRSRSSSSDTSSSSAPAEPRERPSRKHEVAASAEPAVEPAPSRSSKPAAASGIGLLRLNSRPWSQVFVDGKPMGNTPQMGMRLPAGSHQIELINREMGMGKKFQVKIVADEVVTRIETLTE
jgi:serine/threonine-protein kinase